MSHTGTLPCPNSELVPEHHSKCAAVEAEKSEKSYRTGFRPSVAGYDPSEVTVAPKHSMPRPSPAREPRLPKLAVQLDSLLFLPGPAE